MKSLSTDEKTLSIVGAGPSCVYVLERLAANVSSAKSPFFINVNIFEKSGEFGSGQVHSTRQPKSSFLNRIAGQVAFAADETVEESGPLISKEERLVLNEWCMKEYKRTGDLAYQLAPEDWPKRYVHGHALRHYFYKYCDILKSSPFVNLRIYHAEVVDIIETGKTFLLISKGENDEKHESDYVLFATGHSENDPEKDPSSKKFLEFSQKHNATYIYSAYPLESAIPNHKTFLLDKVM